MVLGTCFKVHYNVMIDPVHSLAFSIQSNRGVYALLLGSGVSRSATIPAGWEITGDLIRKLAKLHEETCDPDPEDWYRCKFDMQANYSDLIDTLAKTPAERQQLLRTYFEPDDREREEDEKKPTKAHHAIAKLAAQGYLKVILTTNFDRLVETALTDAGVVPTVLSSTDQIQGTLPLIHTQCCVIKLHGDYLDTRIRNTSAELNQYPAELDQLLDRIFDEFGLIVCGWSAEWDGALRSALFRASSRRFSTYWAARSEPKNEAKRIIEHRQAALVRIEDADTFFHTIQQYVESIEQFSTPHPLSVEAAVTSLKRYIAEDKFRIQMSELVDATVEQAIETITSVLSTLDSSSTPTSESVTKLIRHYEQTCSTLLSLAVVGGFWAEARHEQVWRRALERLVSFEKPTDSMNNRNLWTELRRYPATLLLYALGIGAVSGGRLRFLGSMFSAEVCNDPNEKTRSVQILPPFCMFWNGGQTMRILEDMDRHHAPLNDWIHDTLRTHTKRVEHDEDRYSRDFDKLELLIALSYAHYTTKESTRDWAPPGRFGYRTRDRVRILDEIKNSLSTEKDDSPYVTCQVFGSTSVECVMSLETLDRYLSNLHWW